MLKNYVPSQYRTITRYQLVFDDGRNNGYAFPCDKDGNFSENLNPCAMESYRRCMENPDKFVRFNKIVETKHRVKDEAHGTCSCGNEVYLYNEYHGACQCEKCGKWYNLFGQELLPPTEWEEEM